MLSDGLPYSANYSNPVLRGFELTVGRFSLWVCDGRHSSHNRSGTLRFYSDLCDNRRHKEERLQESKLYKRNWLFKKRHFVFSKCYSTATPATIEQVGEAEPVRYRNLPTGDQKQQRKRTLTSVVQSRRRVCRIGFYTSVAPEAQRKLAGGGGFAKPPEAMAND